MVPACFIAEMMRPGMAPMYVRRWPRISASSRTPPRLTRTNPRPMAVAMERPRLVLPTPGGPTRQRICVAPRRRRVDRELAHGEKVEDPLLDRFQAEMVRIEDALGFGQIELVFARFAPGQGEDRCRDRCGRRSLRRRRRASAPDG